MAQEKLDQLQTVIMNNEGRARRFTNQVNGTELLVDVPSATVAFLIRDDLGPGIEWRVLLDERLLDRIYPALLPSARELWPDADEERAVFNLMGVHLQETLLTSRVSRYVELSATPGITFVAVASGVN